MKTIITTLCLTLLTASSLANASQQIRYIEQKPNIDGIRDSFDSAIARQGFNRSYDFDNQFEKDARVTYSINYHKDGLYLTFETDSNQISYHRRGYLWGDGFKVIIGPAAATGISSRFIEMTFSPAPADTPEQQQMYIASVDFDGVLRKFSPESSFAQQSHQQGSFFEAFISWDDIYPYHALFNQQLGINLYFAKGLRSPQGDYVTRGFALVHDEAIWDEQISYRYLSAFDIQQPPSALRATSAEFSFDYRTITEGAKLPVTLATNNFAKLTWKITQQQKVAALGNFSFGSTQAHRRIPTQNLKAGRYLLQVSNGSNSQTKTFQILPSFDFTQAMLDLADNQAITSGSRDSLLFEIESVYHQLSNLKTDQMLPALGEQILSIKRKLALVEASVDPYKDQKGPYRRAFRSALDGTLQPYTIKLPDNYDSQRAYPLMVFLHGSGQNEQTLLNRQRSSGNFIELAPLARDKFQAYAWEHSHVDILEAIDDVKEHFSVDTDNLFIGGFSMGGYGALITHYRSPELFKGVAVFAGHPNLANEWIAGDFPNFLLDKYTYAFKQTPVFIYHGEQDPALSVTLIKQLATQLEKSGAVVTSAIVPNRGHVYQDDRTHKRYQQWLEQQLKQ